MGMGKLFFSFLTIIIVIIVVVVDFFCRCERKRGIGGENTRKTDLARCIIGSVYLFFFSFAFSFAERDRGRGGR